MNLERSEHRTSGAAALSLELQVRIDELCGEFLLEQQAGRRPQIEAFLERLPIEARPWLLKELLAEESEWRRGIGQEVQAQEYFARLEQDQAAVAEAFQLDVSGVESTTDLHRPEEDSKPAAPRARIQHDADGPCQPDWHVHGFEIQGEIGRGGMGVVLRARDLELDRDVALKVLRQDKGDASDLALRFVIIAGAEEMRYGYDGFGNLLWQSNAADERTQFRYDQLGRTIEQLDPALHPTRFTYDLLGRQTAVLDPNGNLTTFQYDALGQLTAEQIQLSVGVQTRSFQYDTAGNRTVSADRRGWARTVQYDALNRPTKERWYDSLANAVADTDRKEEMSFGYDKGSRLRRAEGSDFAYTYDYDNLDRPLNEEVLHTPYQIHLFNGYPNRQDARREYLNVSIGGVAV